MTELALEVRNLKKSYRGFSLEDVSFEIPRGYVMGLVGPNGAGKTTIVKAIMNLVARDGGEVRVGGLDNLADEVAVKARIGFVYDEPAFYLDCTLDEHRRAVAPLYPEWSDADYERLVKRFELPRDRKFKALSHGMKTKFALVLALSHGADLLVLDEPTTGLDPVFRRELLDLLAEILEDEKKSILFSTHIVSDLERIADYVTFLRGGRIVLSIAQDELAEKWGVVRGDEAALAHVREGDRHGVRRGAYGIEVLTSDAPAARRSLGERAVVERATLEEIMFLMTGEEGHVAPTRA